jgi:hypothetical protein
MFIMRFTYIRHVALFAFMSALSVLATGCAGLSFGESSQSRSGPQSFSQCLNRPCYLRYDQYDRRLEDNYPLFTSDHWSGVGPYADDITAAFLNPDESKYYLFLGNGGYLRFDVSTDSLDDGYPVSIAGHWRGIRGYDAQQITAALISDNRREYYFFLRDGRYIRYDIFHDAAKGPPIPMEQSREFHALSPYARQIVAAASSVDGRTFYFFLRNRQYIHYSANPQTGGRILGKGDLRAWGRMGVYASQITAAVNKAGNPEKIYFFLRDNRR